MKPVINDGTRARFGRLEAQSREEMIQATAREVLERASAPEPVKA